MILTPDDAAQPQYYSLDNDGNGNPDEFVVDIDRDGAPDYSAYDTDEDGKMDLLGYYRPGEDVPFRFARYSDENDLAGLAPKKRP